MRLRDDLRCTVQIEFGDYELEDFVATLGRVQVTGSGQELHTVSVLLGKLKRAIETKEGTMRNLLLATVAVGALGLAVPAHATLQICASEDGGTASCGALSSTGAATFSPTLVNFANVTVSSTGVPIESSPDLATTDLSADATTTFTGTHTLEIEVFQTGLAPVNANLRSTFTINGLISTGSGFPGPSTLSDFTGGSGTGLGTALHSATFPAEAIGASIQGPTALTGITSDAQEFLVTFTKAGQSVTDTIQTIGVVSTPEPSSLAIFGLGLVGLGLVARRRPTRR